MQEIKLKSKLSNLDLYEDNDIALRCISAFEKLLLTHNVNLNDLHTMAARNVIKWGLPLTYLNEESLSDLFFKEFVSSFIKNGLPTEDSLAEVQALGLLLALGANGLTKKQRRNDPIHDFDLLWANGIIEVEVTKASTKEAHILRDNQAKSILEKIFDAKNTFDIHLYIESVLSENLLQGLLDSCETLKCGETIDVRNYYQLRGVPIERDVDEFFTFKKNSYKPEWWPEQIANLLLVKQMGPGPDCKVAPPQVKIEYAVPITGYLNSARRKASNFQGSRNNPFLILIDVTNLPNGIAIFKKGIRELLINWADISGILLFFEYSSTYDREIGWEFKLFANDNAHHKLPGGLTKKLCQQKTNMRLIKKNS